ncbi:MAG: sugar ABC transporter permease [Clostridia bacterium]|nr:sugar ABC transporter permease [Clostridia bacterium]
MAHIVEKKSKKIKTTGKFIKDFKLNYDLYLLLIPGLALLIIFKYVPMYGVSIAFQDFNIFKGISGSEWVGMDNFIRLFHSEEFYKIFRNTLVISIYKIVFSFPIPILIAIMLNEMKKIAVKRVVQTVIYLPHFLSWVIVGGIFTTILSTNGLINGIIMDLGGESIPFMMSNRWFRSILIISDIWKGCGWGAIVYIAAIAGIDQELYEAAEIDGAGKIRQILHITLPGLSSTIVLMLILKLGYIMVEGQEQVLMMYNPTVYETGDIITTYVYRIGMGKMDYSFSSAVGLLNSVISLVLVWGGNFLSGKLVGKSIW